MTFDNKRIRNYSVIYSQQDAIQEFLLILLIAVSSFGESLRPDNLTALAEACFNLPHMVIRDSGTIIP
jgi:hypothetical protein